MDTEHPRTTQPAPRSRRERCEVLIIGAGQAGLSAAYHLQQLGRPAVVVDANERVGDTWRRHWDSLRLYSPAGYDGLPGMAFPAPRWSFPTKDEVADYLEDYARTFAIDVRTGVRVRALTRDGDGYLAHTDDVTFEADDVIVAIGTFGRPWRPAFAADLDPAILQLHSSEYQRPTQLAPGPVLVVGASHSGADLAMEVAAEHSTVLVGPDHGQLPVPLESRRARRLFPLLWLAWGHVINRGTPIGRRMEHELRHAGAPLLRYRRRDLEEAGIERVTEKVVGTEAGAPVLESGRVLTVANVLWCTGFRHDLSWIDLPVVADDGWPREHRGVVDEQPGLYFTGLGFQWSFRSMLMGGAGDDAAYVARHLVERHRVDERAAVSAGA